jgi:hypothetical protein
MNDPLPSLKVLWYHHSTQSPTTFPVDFKLGLQSNRIILAADETTPVLNDIHAFFSASN